MRHLRASLLFIPVLAIAACTGCKSFPGLPEHVVAVSRQGKLIDIQDRTKLVIDKHHIDQPEYDRYFGRIGTNILARGLTNIVIFAQGGLNTEKDGRRRSMEQTDAMAKDGCYPIFLAWNSSLFDTYAEHLFFVRRGKTEKMWGIITSPLYLLADLGRVVTRAPVTWFHQLQSDYKSGASYVVPYRTDCRASALEDWCVSIRDVNHGYCQLVTNGFTNVWMREREIGKSDVGDSISYWLTVPFKIVTDPVVDAAGKSAWDNMLRRTQTMWVTPTTFETGAMESFARYLKDFLRTNSQFQITLVGHSMGSIILNELVRRHGDELPISNIVYVAAACGVDDFYRKVVPYLESHAGARFYNVTLHPLNDAREDHLPLFYGLGEVAPRGSLLEWIDNFYSSAETDFGRTLGKWDNAILAMRAIPKEVWPQISLKAFGVGPEERQGMQYHGGIDDFKYWDRRFWSSNYWDKSLLAK